MVYISFLLKQYFVFVQYTLSHVAMSNHTKEREAWSQKPESLYFICEKETDL